jgi:hypothetical protein
VLKLRTQKLKLIQQLYYYPNSRKSRPTKPSKKITGYTAATEIEITAKKISFDPLIAASIGVIPQPLKYILGNYNTVIYNKPSTIASNVNTFIEKPKPHDKEGSY